MRRIPLLILIYSAKVNLFVGFLWSIALGYCQQKSVWNLGVSLFSTAGRQQRAHQKPDPHMSARNIGRLPYLTLDLQSRAHSDRLSSAASNNDARLSSFTMVQRVSCFRAHQEFVSEVIPGDGTIQAMGSFWVLKWKSTCMHEARVC